MLVLIDGDGIMRHGFQAIMLFSVGTDIGSINACTSEQYCRIRHFRDMADTVMSRTVSDDLREGAVGSFQEPTLPLVVDSGSAILMHSCVGHRYRTLRTGYCPGR